MALHRLEVPSTLNKTFLSTNHIENVIRNWRASAKGVKRWREGGDMIERWVSTGLLWAESGFRKVNGHADLRELELALRQSPVSPAGSGSGLRPSPPPPGETGEGACETQDSQPT